MARKGRPEGQEDHAQSLSAHAKPCRGTTRVDGERVSAKRVTRFYAGLQRGVEEAKETIQSQGGCQNAKSKGKRFFAIKTPLGGAGDKQMIWQLVRGHHKEGKGAKGEPSEGSPRSGTSKTSNDGSCLHANFSNPHFPPLHLCLALSSFFLLITTFNILVSTTDLLTEYPLPRTGQDQTCAANSQEELR